MSWRALSMIMKTKAFLHPALLLHRTSYPVYLEGLNGAFPAPHGVALTSKIMTIMNKLSSLLFISFFALVLFILPSLGHAEPRAWEINFQEAATPVAERLHDFHGFLLYIITGIVVFVLGLLLFVILRFNAKANPVPSTTTHHVLLEIVWTVVPVVILALVAVKSIPLLYYADRTETPEMTLKVTGYQWYWGYEYPDNGGISFTSNLIKDADIDASKGQVRLLSTDNPVVLPVDTDIQILVTGADVIHSFAVPSFGIKIDAIPGRTNETWVRITKPGVYYGQCDQLCGNNHGFMPVEVIAMSKEDFAAWVIKQNGGTEKSAAATVKEKLKVAKKAATKEETSQH